MTLAQQDRMLAETLKELETETAAVGKLGDAWKAGDVAALERIALAELKSDPEMYQRLLVERNKNWMPKIQVLFRAAAKRWSSSAPRIWSAPTV